MTDQTIGCQRACAEPDIPEQILFGRSAVMREVRRKLEKIACTSVPVLIVGESGTGKEVIARYIHSRSLCRDGAFVRINCAGASGRLLQSDLLGHGPLRIEPTATARLSEPASSGTLFFDGIGEMDFALQSKLLHLLQEGRFPGSRDPDDAKINVRIICAARHPLETELQARRFREDLFYRINVVTVELPPLRERRFDIPELIDFFLSSVSREFGRATKPIGADTLKLLVAGDWPGNIRQLENVIKRYVIFDSEDALLAPISAHTAGERNLSTTASSQRSLKEVTRDATRELERRVILEALSANHWHRMKTAEALHISYKALLYKMKQSGLPMKRLHSETPGGHDR